MALTRKFLTALGIEADKIDEIITAHSETVEALKEQRDSAKGDLEKYKADAEELQNVKNELDKAKVRIDAYREDAEKLPGVQKELDELKAANESSEDYKKKYDELKVEYDNYKTDRETRDAKSKIEEAYKKLLINTGISDKRVNAVLKVSDLSGVELDEEGNVKDADKIAESVKNEWSDFIVTEGAQGAATHNPPSSGNKKMTKEEIMKIKDAGERQRAIAENHEEFGF